MIFKVRILASFLKELDIIIESKTTPTPEMVKQLFGNADEIPTGFVGPDRIVEISEQIELGLEPSYKPTIEEWYQIKSVK